MSKRWRWLRLIFALGVTLLSLGLLGLGCAISCRPSDYQPLTLDYARLDDDKRALSGVLERIGVELNRGRPVEFDLEESQINRWIAARRELPIDPGLLDVQGLQKPAVRLLDGHVRLYGLTERSGWQSVVSLDVSLRIEDDAIQVTPARAAFGAAPLPAFAMEAVRTTLAELLTPEGGRADGEGVAIPNHAVWENGRRPFRFERIEITPGKARIRLAPIR